MKKELKERFDEAAIKKIEREIENGTVTYDYQPPTKDEIAFQEEVNYHHIVDEARDSALFECVTTTFDGMYAPDEVIGAIDEIKAYHLSTLEDKYEAGNSNMSQIMSDTHGKSINTFSASKYINRYMTEGFDKSDNRKDVIKAIHYLLFELARTA